MRKKADAVQYERVWSEPLRMAKSAESSIGHVQSVQAREQGLGHSIVVGGLPRESAGPEGKQELHALTT